MLWEASDRIFGKRLKPLLPILISSIEQHGHLKLDDLVRTLLLQMSAATIDRALKNVRETAGGRRRRRPVASSALKLLTEVLTELRRVMPFPLLGFDTDNDSVCINDTIRDECVGSDSRCFAAGNSPYFIAPLDLLADLETIREMILSRGERWH